MILIERGLNRGPLGEGGGCAMHHQRLELLYPTRKNKEIKDIISLMNYKTLLPTSSAAIKVEIDRFDEKRLACLACTGYIKNCLGFFVNKSHNLSLL